jgi:PPOX class probable F420-dependent enzyme
VLEEGVRRLAKGKNFAAFTTLLPDGQPMTHVMWVDCDDEHVLINTEVHRQKARNIRRDPRVTVTIWDQDEPYRYAEVRGEVVETVSRPRGQGPHRRAVDEVPRPRVPQPDPVRAAAGADQAPAPAGPEA